MSSRVSRLVFLAERLLALVIFVALSPLFLLLALLMVVVDRQDIFFRQTRVGMEGKPFTLIKFRTMRQDADPYTFKPEDNDPVITPLGRLLRPRAIDELPQLLNVVRGKLALVGPRPEMGFIVDQYNDVERMRLRVRPGLTGLWQLSRVRDRLIHHHIEYDLFYVFNKSLGLDIWLLWRTFLFALTGRSTKIRLAVQRWERNTAWRNYVPDRAGAIPKRTRPLLSLIWLGTALAIFFTMMAPSVAMALLAKGDLEEARTHLTSARGSMKRLEPRAANTALDRADSSLQRANSRLRSWVTRGGRLVPGIAQNLETADNLATAGRHLVEAGRQGVKVLTSVPVQGGRLSVPWRDGGLDLQPFVSAAGPAQQMRSSVTKAKVAISEENNLLIPAVRKARAASAATLEQASNQVDAAVGAAVLIPKMLGGEGTRRWILGAENNAELRGRGGYLGSFGILTAEGGKLSLDEFQATAELPRIDGPSTSEIPEEYRDHYLELGALDAWQNILMSPHFPSGAQLFLDELKTRQGIHAEGVISLDPIALSYLLDVTGPLQVPGVPQLITSENLTEYSLNKIYFDFSKRNEERRELLSLIADAIWSKILSAQNLDSKKLGEALGRAISERHLVIYSARADEQAILEKLGMSGVVRDTEGDYLMLVAQNFSENKMDYYIKRSLKYRASVGLDGTIRSTLEVAIRNDAPKGIAYPDYIGGPRPGIGLEAGRSRDFFSVFVPPRAELVQVRTDGDLTTAYDNDLELGKRRFGAMVELAAGESRTLTFEYEVPRILDATNRYSLLIQNQALVTPDDIDISVSLPRQVEIASRQGFSRGVPLRFQGALSKDLELYAALDTPLTMRLATKLSSWLHRPVVE